MFEKPKKRISKPKLSSEKRKIVNLVYDVTDQNIKSNANKEDIKQEETFDNIYESPKEQRTELKLTSGGRKAKFQLKHSIDEKKDKSHDNGQKEDTQTIDSQIAVENANGALNEDHALKKHVKERHDKSPKVPSKTTEVKLSNGGKIKGKFTNEKLGGKFTNDVLIKRKDNNENGFRFSFLHGTTSIPSRIPVMVRFNGQNTPLTRLNNERSQSNSVRRIPFSVLKVNNKKHKAKTTGPLAVRSTPERKTSVRRGTDLKTNSTRNAKSPNDDSGLPRKRERYKIA
ncbi:unnamed protein product [Mytilus edulis]|uniref:Uncharacterized protein n=1 Tax=Mytilus edulis TaxID=6550 RepID=A0A8S3R5Z0_MYTED|nr:unnamed protein product [Mytilus edulis]